ncbi:MAG: DUF1697 domain-containing protein [Candidatus Moranbacteria bacterium]|nr:DUF1697 domain-containing protein [Candidatus Moranbacteria bacterium]
MKYIVLLRGINVGGNKKVEMKKLKALVESLGCLNVLTYINSGNIIFHSDKNKESVRQELEKSMKKEFGFEIQVLVKTEKEMQKIALAIPRDWHNDIEQKTDVAYLFADVDTRKIIDELPIKKEFVDMRYVKGAIFWNVKRKNYNKSHLNKIISHEAYKSMTVRNVNTARYLADCKATMILKDEIEKMQ